MKKFIAWLLVLTLTAAVSIGATLAYLTDTDEDVNVMTLGKVKIDQLEYERIDTESKDDTAKIQDFHDNKPLYPAVIDKEKFDWETGENYVNWDQIGKDDYTSGIWNPDEINNEVDKMVFVKNKGDYDAYVRSVFAFEAGNYETVEEFLSKVHLNINTEDWTWDWEQTPVSIPNADGSETTDYFIVTATYNKVLKPGAFTEISLAQIALDPSATNEDVKAFGDTFQVLVKSQAIQAEGFGNELLPEYENANNALDEGFGPVRNQLPFENDSPYRGIDLRTALHNYQGDTSKVITSKVTNVVFDLNEKYPEIVKNYKGTLVDVEQDVDVYAYYVDLGNTYTVYFLAEDTIYSPKDSSFLFANMTALTAVDTTNFDVSRVQTMKRMFYGDKTLAKIDVSRWDTSNVTDMNGTFFQCFKVTPLDVSNWNTGNVTNMYAMFYRCEAITNLDVSRWQVGNVTNMEFTFDGCKNITKIDVADWDVSKVTSFDSFFSAIAGNIGNMKLQKIDVSKWDTSSATGMYGMFYGCGSITSLDLRGLDVQNVTDFGHMFSDCYALTHIDFTGWDTGSVDSFAAMFNDCDSIERLDVSEFDTNTARYFNQMFESCDKLKEITGLENFNTSNVVSFYEMFNGSYSLVELNLSSFDTPSLTETMRTFNGCSSLKTIYVGDGWDMSKVTSYDSMFSSCNSLVGGAGTTFMGTDLKYAHVDGGAENPGYLTHIADKK